MRAWQGPWEAPSSKSQGQVAVEGRQSATKILCLDSEPLPRATRCKVDQLIKAGADVDKKNSAGGAAFAPGFRGHRVIES